MNDLAIAQGSRSGYRDDIAAWSGAQAALLRAGRLQDADIEHIIEEIESLGASERTAIASQIDRIIEHLLKLIYSPAQNPRRGWRASIRNARLAIVRQLEQSPSLKRELPSLVANAMPRAAAAAAGALLDYEEIAADQERVVRDHVFSPEQVLDDWFPDA